MSGFPYVLGPSVASISNTADADLLTRLSIAFAVKQRAAWRVVQVRAQDGIVRLQGIVPTFHDRQLILAIAQHVAGVLRVEDELAIADAPRHPADPPAAETGAAPVARPAATNAFHHLPELSESLEEILAKRQAAHIART